MDTFADRREAGRKLAGELTQYRGEVTVFALPRGGVEVAVEVSDALNAPLDMLVARKIGHPYDPEYAVCAVTETGPLVCNEVERANVDKLWLEQAEKNERAEARRRRETYQEGRDAVSAKGKTAIVVDDGIATGLTMRAAVAELPRSHPEKIIVAVPCAPREVVEELREYAQEVIVLADPDDFQGAISMYYDYFPQLTDVEVINLLDEAEAVG
jgi:putative phosphoribosyl transferase